MATEIELNIVEDVFDENDVLGLQRPSTETCSLGCINFVTQAEAGESRATIRWRCMDVAIRRLRLDWSQFTLWLFVCHSAWREMNARTSYLRLWRSFEQSKVALPTGERSDEMQVESPDGVRFFGRLRVPDGEEERAYNVINAECKSFIVGTTVGDAPRLDERLLGAWQRDRLELAWWGEFASVVCCDGHLLFRPFGFFDDVEVGVDIILKTEFLKGRAAADSP